MARQSSLSFVADATSRAAGSPGEERARQPVAAATQATTQHQTETNRIKADDTARNSVSKNVIQLRSSHATASVEGPTLLQLDVKRCHPTWIKSCRSGLPCLREP